MLLFGYGHCVSELGTAERCLGTSDAQTSPFTFVVARAVNWPRGTGACLIGGLPFSSSSLESRLTLWTPLALSDGDKTLATKCVRQLFSEPEIGLCKLVVLVNRLNLFGIPRFANRPGVR